jgi:hypothetical protein
MTFHFREFQAGPDPYGKVWNVRFVWLQTGISIRHADTVDVKFQLSEGGRSFFRVVAMSHPDLLRVARQTGRPLTDPWCSRLAALHVRHMIETGEDMEKTLVTVSPAQLERYAATLGEQESAAVGA